MKFHALAAIVLVGIAETGRGATLLSDMKGGWGVDGCISFISPVEDVDSYIDLLEQGNLRWIREREAGVFSPASRALPIFRKLQKASLNVVAFAQLSKSLSVADPPDQLPKDLFAVYQSAREMSRLAGDAVNAWEMVGEPDVSYCHDLPERVAAYQKAVYLGIKDGSLFPAGVLMGALGLPPGPWLERAARNGLYDYTDGLNFHFYGVASDLTGVIEAQRNFAQRFVSDRKLPMWITECGMNAIPEGKMDDPHARQLQRKFTAETARIAAREKIAVFMPFVFVAAAGDGYSLTRSRTEPYPAWTTYAALTRTENLPPVPALAPDNLTCIPHKVSGTYWFDNEEEGSDAIEGEFVVYNFSGSPVRGDLETRGFDGIRVAIDGKSGDTSRKVTIPPLGSVRVPVTFAADTTRYFRGEIEVVFRREKSNASTNLVFGLETRPADALLKREVSIQGHRPTKQIQWIWAPEPYRVSSRGGPWLGINGVKIGDGDAEIVGGPLERAWRFQVMKRQIDPRIPPMAVTKVAGLPNVANGFLRLRIVDGESSSTDIRVDLVDIHGQRFSVAENYGMNWEYPDRNEIFLSYRDFHPYVWGRNTGAAVFRPEDIREIQLRFSSQLPSRPIDVRLDIVAPDENNLS
jgi:hypothetical protein